MRTRTGYSDISLALPIRSGVAHKAKVPGARRCAAVPSATCSAAHKSRLKPFHSTTTRLHFGKPIKLDRAKENAEVAPG